MSRFIVLFALGALLVGASQLALSLGTHPDHLASLRYILQGSAHNLANYASLKSDIKLGYFNESTKYNPQGPIWAVSRAGRFGCDFR